MSTRIITIFAILTLAFISCKDNSTSPDDNNNNNNEPSVGVYFPLKVGNWWKYKHNLGGMELDLLIKVEGTTMIDGKKWYKVGSPAEWQYYRYEGSILSMITTRNGFQFEFQMFSENGKTGDSLITDVIYKNTPNRIVCKITNKYQSLAVRGVEYKDVLEVTMNSYIWDDEEWFDSYMENFYFARDIGLIKIEVPELMLRELIEYSVSK